ncbi:hypothetical protein [Massilia sp. ST3]|uniref:hypothetical protein n=1 Tax=Massilia sp. ST3 TaxID=2824903 RepID=UPI001B832B55|nr:hypothetical protein [Massilia sp. ST3]MBQ5948185.1 hypothetical protein [Massilia sp. ST3]
MASNTIRKLLLGACCATLLGCAPATPRWDREFGNAVRANLSAQVLDPAASASTDPVTGIDGHAARAAHERYQRSYARPDAEPARSLVTQ